MESFAIFVVVVVACLVILVIGMVIAGKVEQGKLQSMDPDQRRAYLDQKRQKRLEASARATDTLRGPLNSQIVCPQCQTRGRVRTKQVRRKAGISGGKATAAVITAGVSVLATGLSRKENVTEAHCENCGSTWHF